MSLLLLALLPCLVAAPLYTQAVFREVWENERRVILLDNAAIRWGRHQRALLNELRRLNQAAARVDHVHHLWHACARTPGPQQTECEVVDRAMEAELLSTAKAALAWATVRWREALFEAHRGVSAIPGCSIRTPDPPFELRRCATCGKEVFLDVSAQTLRSHFVVDDHREYPLSQISVELLGRSLRQAQEWNYVLRLP